MLGQGQQAHAVHFMAEWKRRQAQVGESRDSLHVTHLQESREKPHRVVQLPSHRGPGIPGFCVYSGSHFSSLTQDDSQGKFLEM